MKCIDEANRGYIQSKNKEPQKVPQLPFGIAVACLLKLITDGHLRMSEAFSADCLYGVFTGTSVMNKKLVQTINKFNALFSLFVEKYAEEIEGLVNYQDAGHVYNVVFEPNFFHDILKESDGGESESDNENYNNLSTDFDDSEISEDLKIIEEKTASLNITPMKF